MNIEQNFDPRSQFNQSNVSHVASQSQGAPAETHAPLRARASSLGLERPGGGAPTPLPLSGSQAPRGEYPRHPEDFDRAGYSEQKPLQMYHQRAPTDYGQYQNYQPGYQDTGRLAVNHQASEPALASYQPSNRVCLTELAPEPGQAQRSESEQQLSTFQREQDTGNWR
jgi:hypothetical protein